MPVSKERIHEIIDLTNTTLFAEEDDANVERYCNKCRNAISNLLAEVERLQADVDFLQEIADLAVSYQELAATRQAQLARARTVYRKYNQCYYSIKDEMMAAYDAAVQGESDDTEA